MKEKIRLITMNILLNIVFNIVFYTLIILVVYYGAPLHETFHYLPCKAVGLNPNMTYFQVNCNGIAEKSHLIQFFYFMGPYLFYLVVLIVLYLLSSKNNYLKYLIPKPFFDVLYNYISSLNQSDFRFLLQNTFPDKIPFIFAMLLVAIILLMTIKAYFKYRIFSFSHIINKMFYNQQ